MYAYLHLHDYDRYGEFGGVFSHAITNFWYTVNMLSMILRKGEQPPTKRPKNAQEKT